MATITTTVSRDPALVALLEASPDYPGASFLLDLADRQWLLDRGIQAPPKAATLPLHELARRARIQRQNKPAKKKIRGTKKAT